MTNTKTSDEIKQLFEKLDLDQDGKISTEELSKGLKGLGKFVPISKTKEILQELDNNKDGLVDVEELSETFKEIKLGKSIKHVELINALLDKHIKELTNSVEKEKSQEKKDQMNKKLAFIKETKHIYEEQAVSSSKVATKWLEMQRKVQEEKDQNILIDLKRKRVDNAANWMDKEIRKLIAHLKKNGNPPHYEITYGKLFKLAEDNMEALSGILKLGKKAGAVAFESKNEILMQGRDDDVVISLITEDFTSTEKKYTEVDQIEKKSLVMDIEKLKEVKLGEVKTTCNICKKKVLPSEEVTGLSIMGAIVLHQECFKCKYCQQKLSVGAFTELDGKYYCIPHYKSLFMKKTSYDFEEKKEEKIEEKKEEKVEEKN